MLALRRLLADSARLRAWRYRVLTLTAVAAFLGAARVLFSDPVERAEREYLFVITLGYGHLIGAVVAPRLRAGASAADDAASGAWRALSVLTLFSLYTVVAAQWPAVFVPLIAVSIWHTVENDEALAAAHRAGLRLPPLPRELGRNASALALSALIMALALASLDPETVEASLHGTIFAGLDNTAPRLVAGCVGAGAVLRASTRGGTLRGLALLAAAALVPRRLPALAFGDVFSAVTLHHLVGWLVLFGERARAARRAGAAASRAVWCRLLGVHLPPTLVCVALLAWPGDAAASLRALVFSPPIYLFWSTLHVLETAVARGLAPRVLHRA